MLFNAEPLKEPRGFLRLIQWFIAMLAFATCCDFSTQFGFRITCKNSTDPSTNDTTPKGPFNFSITATYPFRLNHEKNRKYEVNMCDPTQANKTEEFQVPGDYSSDAQFFVFIGVIVWLYSMASLILYVFYSNLYTDEQKNFPKMDFILAAILAFIWLAASSAWANGFLQLKSTAYSSSWIYESGNSFPCEQNENNFKYPNIEACEPLTPTGGFGTGNASILFGFLNCFLWVSNTWFLYKETAWYRSRNPDFQTNGI